MSPSIRGYAILSNLPILPLLYSTFLICIAYLELTALFLLLTLSLSQQNLQNINNHAANIRAELEKSASQENEEMVMVTPSMDNGGRDWAKKAEIMDSTIGRFRRT